MKKQGIADVCCWRDADLVLSQIARFQKRLGRIRERAEGQIAAIEQRLGEASDELLPEIEKARQELERFFRQNSEGMRSRSLPSGRIGLRTTNRIEVSRPRTTLRRLAKRGLGDCIRVRQEIDRQALGRLDAETLRSVGIKRVERETFYAVPRTEK